MAPTRLVSSTTATPTTTVVVVSSKVMSGTLTPGKQADLILLRTDLPNILPVNDPISAVTWGMDTRNVDSVFVAGKALKRDGKLLNVDLTRLMQKAYESRDYVIAQSGFKRPANAQTYT